MKIALIATLFLSFTQIIHAKECHFTADTKSIEIDWTAFKTPAKIGVSGKLKSFGLQGKTDGKSIADILKTAFITIATQGKSVDTKDPARDAKIAKMFFSTIKDNGTIVARFSKVEKTKLIMGLTMNGVTKDVPLSYVLKKGQLSAKGHIDVLDFAMNTQLASLTKACFAKHEGKTWSDVAISLKAKFNRICK